MNALKTLLSVFVTKVEDSSGKGKVNMVDLAKVVRTSVFVGLASGLTHSLGLLNSENLGPIGYALAIPAITAVIELVTKLAKDNE